MPINDDIRDNRMWLMVGRCQDRLKDIPDASVDMFYVGLPYGSTDQEWDVIIPPAEFWAEVKRIRKPGAPVCFLCNARLAASLIESNKDEFKDLIVWAKPQAVDQANKVRFRQAAEYIVIFCDDNYKDWNPVESTGERYTEANYPTKPTGVSVSGDTMYSKHRECPPCHVAADGSVHRLPVLNVACEKCGAVPGAACTNNKGKATATCGVRIKTYLAGEVRCDVCDLDVPADDITGVRYPTNVRYFPQDNARLGEFKHETPNPVSVSSYFIDCLTKVGDTVCDFTMGCGTTGVAAVNMGRYFIGIEKEYIPFFYNAAHNIQNTTLGSNKEYEEARKLTNNFSQNAELLKDADDAEKRAKRLEKELSEFRELANKAVLVTLMAASEGLTTAQAAINSGLPRTLAQKTLERMEESGTIVRNQAVKGGTIRWTLKPADQAASAKACGD